MQNVICYNEREVREGQGSKEDALWIDIENPIPSEISSIEQSFNRSRRNASK